MEAGLWTPSAVQGALWEGRGCGFAELTALEPERCEDSVEMAALPLVCLAFVPGGILEPHKAHLSSLVAGQSFQLCHTSPC